MMSLGEGWLGPLLAEEAPSVAANPSAGSAAWGARVGPNHPEEHRQIVVNAPELGLGLVKTAPGAEGVLSVTTAASSLALDTGAPRMENRSKEGSARSLPLSTDRSSHSNFGTLLRGSPHAVGPDAMSPHRVNDGCGSCCNGLLPSTGRSTVSSSATSSMSLGSALGSALGSDWDKKMPSHVLRDHPRPGRGVVGPRPEKASSSNASRSAASEGDLSEAVSRLTRDVGQLRAECCDGRAASGIAMRELAALRQDLLGLKREAAIRAASPASGANGGDLQLGPSQNGLVRDQLAALSRELASLRGEFRGKAREDAQAKGKNEDQAHVVSRVRDQACEQAERVIELQSWVEERLMTQAEMQAAEIATHRVAVEVAMEGQKIALESATKKVSERASAEIQEVAEEHREGRNVLHALIMEQVSGSEQRRLLSDANVSATVSALSVELKALRASMREEAKMFVEDARKHQMEMIQHAKHQTELSLNEVIANQKIDIQAWMELKLMELHDEVVDKLASVASGDDGTLARREMSGRAQEDSSVTSGMLMETPERPVEVPDSPAEVIKRMRSRGEKVALRQDSARNTTVQRPVATHPAASSRSLQAANLSSHRPLPAALVPCGSVISAAAAGNAEASVPSIESDPKWEADAEPSNSPSWALSLSPSSLPAHTPPRSAALSVAPSPRAAAGMRAQPVALPKRPSTARAACPLSPARRSGALGEPAAATSLRGAGAPALAGRRSPTAPALTVRGAPQPA